MNHAVGEVVTVKTYQVLVSDFGRPHSGPYGMSIDMRNGFMFVSAMESYCGHKVTIRSVNHTKEGQIFYRIDEDNGVFVWTDNMFVGGPNRHTDSSIKYWSGE